MAALMRNARVPVWVLCSHSRRPRLAQSFHSVCKSSRKSTDIPLVQTVTRCTSTTTMVPASAAVAPAEDRSPAGSAVDRMILSMDKNVRRFGRLGLNDVTDVMQQIEKDGTVTDGQSLLLIRCMGSTLPELLPDTRTAMVDQMWDKMRTLGTSYSTAHYNALLRVYLQNEHKFSPTDFLASMEANNVLPNRVTYQRLVARYCQDGDIKGASQILEHMKTNQLPINENVFNALVTGHFRANDLESANSMLDIMRQAGMEPGVDTYRAFLKGYAEKGDMAGVRQTMEKASENGTNMNPNIAFDVLFTLAKNGKDSEALEFLTTIQKLPGYSTEAMSCSLQLTSLGKDQLAFEVFSTIGKPVVYDKEDSKLGRFLMRGMVRAERPPEIVSATLQKMRDGEYNNDTMAVIAQMAYLNGQTDYAMKTIEYMKDEGFPIRPHYFWPAICQYGDEGEKEKLKSVVKKSSQWCENNEDRFHTLDDYILPALLKLGIPPEGLAAEMKDTDYGPGIMNYAYMLYLLKNKGVEEGLSFGEKNPVFIMYGALKPILTPLYKSSKDIEQVLKVLKFVQTVGQVPHLCHDTNGWFLTDFFYNTSPKQSREAIILAMADKGLLISKEYVEEVKSICSRQKLELSAEALEALESLGSDESSRTPRWRSTANVGQLGAKTRSQLESLLDQNPGDKSVQRSLLAKYCQQGNTEEATELKQKLDSKGFMYSEFDLRQLAFLESVHNNNLAAAEAYLNQLNTQFPDYNNYIRALLNVAALRIKDGKADEALAQLTEYCDQRSAFITEQKFSDSYMLQSDCCRILEALFDTKRFDLTQSFLKLFFERGLVRNGTASILRTYLNGFINNEDVDGAIDALGFVTSTFTKSVSVSELMKMLIKKEDPDRLQKVVDLLTPLRGEMNVLHQLMVAFIECGHVNKARKIVETPGLRAVMNVLVFAAGQLVNQRRLKELEDLVSVTKTLFGADRDELLFQILRYHALEKDWPNALNVLIDYEEEGIMPRPRTLRYLAKALEADKQPVPFDVPQPINVNQPLGKETKSGSAALDVEDRYPLTPVEQKAMALIKSGGLSAVLDMKKDLEQSDDKRQADKFIPSIVDTLLEKKHYKDFRKLMQELSSSGDVETLQDLRSLPYSEEERLIITQQMLVAHVQSGRAEEAVSYLESNPAEIASFFTEKGFDLLVQKHPELMERVESLAEMSVEQKSFKLSNQLWSHYFIQDETSQAEAVLQKYPEMLQTLRVFRPCRHALATKQEDKLETLIDLVRENKPALGIVYRHLLQLHSYNGDTDQIVKVIERLTEDGLTLAILNQQNRNNLQAVFQSQGKPIPNQLAFVQEKPSSSSSDSKSSSSSSDDEAKSTGR